MFGFLIIAASVLLCVGLRSFGHPVLRKLGSFAVLGASFLAGWLLTGRADVGWALALGWLFLPWVAILTQVRAARLPMAKPMRRLSPPPGHFPELEQISRELERRGFQHADDTGWEWEDYHQFFRLFYHSGERLQAALCLVEQEATTVCYITLSSRGVDGQTWMTWNYPFSCAMRFAPQTHPNRVRNRALTLGELLARHRRFLEKSGVGPGQLAETAPEEMPQNLQREMEGQIAHNIKAGLLLPMGGGMVRYSWRGMLYIWGQFLRDFVLLN